MTRFIHDQFAKQYLRELLKPFGDLDRDLPQLWILSPTASEDPSN